MTSSPAVAAYRRLTVTRHTTVTDQVATLNALATAGMRQYASQLLRVDDTGAELEDLTPWLVKPQAGSGAVSRDCATEAHGKVTFGLAKALQWGYDRVQPLTLVSSPNYQAGAWHAFPRGIFVATSPGRDNLDHDAVYDVTGWDRLYLLQSDPQVSFSFAAGSTYGNAVKALFVAAGVLASGPPLSSIATYPGDWVSKTLPAAQSFPPGSGTYLAIINQLLAASGTLPLYTDPTTGRWTITNVPVPATQATLWAWPASDLTSPPASLSAANTGWPERKIIRYSRAGYSGDVYNAPNRWVFIRTGLSFQPAEGNGQYTVNNVTDGPSSQSVVGRTIVKVVALDASTQADLKTQGDRLVTADKASLEKITLGTTPWPAAGHFDVFMFGHAALPNGVARRLQAQSWSLPFGPGSAGGEMTWAANVVGTA